MEKLQWFKFSPSAWMMGNIQRQSDGTQTAFIRLCCVYWEKTCVMTERSAKGVCGKHFDVLVECEVIKVNEGAINILFLDEQLVEISNTSTKNRASASTRWKKAKPNDASVMQKDTTDMRSHELVMPANASVIPTHAIVMQNYADKKRIDKIREDVVLKTALPTITKSSNEKNQKLSDWLKELKPTVYQLKYKNHGLPLEKIEEELQKFDDHHADTIFSDVNHCLNVWAKWCSLVRERQMSEQNQKNNQFTSGRQQTVPAHKISTITAEDAN